MVHGKFRGPMKTVNYYKLATVVVCEHNSKFRFDLVPTLQLMMTRSWLFVAMSIKMAGGAVAN